MEKTKPCARLAKTVIDYLTAPTSTNYVRMIELRGDLDNLDHEDCHLLDAMRQAFDDPAFGGKG